LVFPYQAPLGGVDIIRASDVVIRITLYIPSYFLFGKFSGFHRPESLYKDFPGFACPLIIFPDGELN
ncbi:MAG: hypothetical protein KAU23_10900, partial [Anaerolineales bacterium]|nr:hypothetical protein [Anaerolineales bacterium]